MPNGSAYNPPIFDLAYVISDLHLGGPRGRQMFAAGPQFEIFIDHVLAALKKLRTGNKQARVLLVINGDFVDFLAEDGASFFNLAQSAVMLREILDRQEFEPVKLGLQKFLRADGARLVLTLGNHDLELVLPDTRRTLLELLTDSKAELESKVELCFDGWGYRFQVGGKRALCLHGNEIDPFNFTRYDELDNICRDLSLNGTTSWPNDPDWTPSAGTRMVVKVINPIKQRFPFIDLLKPEQWLAVTVLGILDPSKLKYLDEAMMDKDRAELYEARRPPSERRMLSIPATLERFAGVAELERSGKPFSSLSEDLLEERVERALERNRIDELIHLPPGAEMLGWKDWAKSLTDAVQWMKAKGLDVTQQIGSQVTGTARKIHCDALRLGIRGMVSDNPYQVSALDEFDVRINQTVRADYDVVFAGHTHFRRMARRPNANGLYVNTGTWAGVMTLTRTLVDSPEFEKVYQALRSKNRADLQNPLPGTDITLARDECTVARISVLDNQNVSVALGGVGRSDRKDSDLFRALPSVTLTAQD